MQMEPVAVWEGIQVRRLLTSIEDAELFLVHQWPSQYRGKKLHLRAQIAVLAALDGSGTADEARTAFVAAAEQAKVLATPSQPPTAALAVARPGYDTRSAERCSGGAYFYKVGAAAGLLGRAPVGHPSCSAKLSRGATRGPPLRRSRECGRGRELSRV
jgi:hypothetical protein